MADSDIVSRLLAATDPDATAEEPVYAKRIEKKAAIATEEELIAAHVQAMLGLDRAMDAGEQKRRGRPSKKADQAAKKEQKVPVAAARSAPAQAAVVHEPTFNKKRHKRVLKEQSLRKIAKMLDKAAKKKKKAEKDIIAS